MKTLSRLMFAWGGLALIAFGGLVIYDSTPKTARFFEYIKARKTGPSARVYNMAQNRTVYIVLGTGAVFCIVTGYVVRPKQEKEMK